MRKHFWLALSGWIVTRCYYGLAYAGVLGYDHREGILADVRTYGAWSGFLVRGDVPGVDPLWQYPPGAAALLLAPRGLPWDYQDSFVVLAFAADLILFLLIARLAADRGSSLGLYVWVGTIPLLGLVVYARYDVFVTITAVAALVAVLRRPFLAGAIMAVGALLKLWPALMLLAARPVRGLRRPLSGFVVGGGAIAVALTVAFSDAWAGFSTNQAARGLQIEAVAATPFQLARLWVDAYTVVHGSGALELVGPFSTATTRLAPILTVAGLAVIGLWWLRWGRRVTWTAAVGVDVAFTAVLIVVVTSRVLSPQFLVWLIGLAAVCLCHRDSRLKPVAALVVGSAAFTGVLFPWHYAGVMFEVNAFSITTLAIRNVLLVVATVLAVVKLVRQPTRQPADGEQPSREAADEIKAVGPPAPTGRPPSVPVSGSATSI